jgi:hypothetical protein
MSYNWHTGHRGRIPSRGTAVTYHVTSARQATRSLGGMKTGIMSPPSLRMVGWRRLVTLVAVLITAGIAQTSLGRALARQAGLLQEPAGYTSLSFLRPQSLPDQLTSRRASIDVSFVIHNAAATANYYQWSVFLTQTGHTRRVSSSSLRVGPGHEATINRSVSVDCARGQLHIVVKLAHPAESIDAWALCSSHRS